MGKKPSGRVVDHVTVALTRYIIISLQHMLEEARSLELVISELPVNVCRPVITATLPENNHR